MTLSRCVNQDPYQWIESMSLPVGAMPIPPKSSVGCGSTVTRSMILGILHRVATVYIDPKCADWSFTQYADGLTHPAAEKQFANDIEALEWADSCVLVLPCGSSAHTEVGWCKGRGMKIIVYIPKM